MQLLMMSSLRRKIVAQYNFSGGGGGGEAKRGDCKQRGGGGGEGRWWKQGGTGWPFIRKSHKQVSGQPALVQGLPGSARTTTSMVAFPGVSRLTRGVRIVCPASFTACSMVGNLREEERTKVLLMHCCHPTQETTVGFDCIINTLQSQDLEENLLYTTLLSQEFLLCQWKSQNKNQTSQIGTQIAQKTDGQIRLVLSTILSTIRCLQLQITGGSNDQPGKFSMVRKPLDPSRAHLQSASVLLISTIALPLYNNYYVIITRSPPILYLLCQSQSQLVDTIRQHKLSGRTLSASYQCPGGQCPGGHHSLALSIAPQTLSAKAGLPHSVDVLAAVAVACYSTSLESACSNSFPFPPSIALESTSPSG